MERPGHQGLEGAELVAHSWKIVKRKEKKAWKMWRHTQNITAQLGDLFKKNILHASSATLHQRQKGTPSVDHRRAISISFPLRKEEDDSPWPCWRLCYLLEAKHTHTPDLFIFIFRLQGGTDATKTVGGKRSLSHFTRNGPRIPCLFLLLELIIVTTAAAGMAAAVIFGSRTGHTHTQSLSCFLFSELEEEVFFF